MGKLNLRRCVPGSRALAAAVFLLVAVWAVGQTTRGGGLLREWAFYLPSPVVAVVCLAAAAFCRRKQNTRLAVALALASLAPLAELAASTRFLAESTSGRDQITVIHWNTYGCQLGTDRIAARLERYQPDLCLLSEPGGAPTLAAVTAEMGEGYVDQLFGNLGVIHRGEFHRNEFLANDVGLRVLDFTWRDGARELHGFLVDLAADPLMAREPRLRRVADLIAKHEPDVVMGDFNAPRRSRWIWPAPAGYRHAYESAGGDWPYTWPMPFPVYALDQCLLGETVTCDEYDLVSTLVSDHRLQLLKLRMPKTPP